VKLLGLFTFQEMGKKRLFLFLGLVLPILVFIFLKIFGKNEFDVPYPELQPAVDCPVKLSSPYFVPDTTIGHFVTEPYDLLVVNLGQNSKRLERIVARPKVKFVDSPVNRLSPGHLDMIKHCVLLMHEPANLVLIDNQRRLRGTYDPTDRDELDRLEAEIKILLKEY